MALTTDEEHLYLLVGALAEIVSEMPHLSPATSQGADTIRSWARQAILDGGATAEQVTSRTTTIQQKIQEHRDRVRRDNQEQEL